MKKHLDNSLTAGNKSLISTWSLPGNNDFIDLELTSGLITVAPSNGYFVFDKESGTTGEGKYFGVELKKTNGGVISRVYWLDKPEVASYHACGIVPVSKGQKIKLNFTITGTVNYFRFVPAYGEV